MVTKKPLIIRLGVSLFRKEGRIYKGELASVNVALLFRLFEVSEFFICEYTLECF